MKNTARRGERFENTGTIVGEINGSLWVAYDNCSVSFAEQCKNFDAR